MAGKVGLVTVHATLLQGVAALNCANGVIGGAVAGKAFDTEWYGYLIAATAVTATTLTVTGLVDSAGTQQPMLLSGAIATDTLFWFPEPILNEFAPFTFQPSAAAKVWVFTRQYSGPEAPTPSGFELR